MTDENIYAWKEQDVKSSPRVNVVSPKLKVLWIVNLDYKSGINHGGNLRFINLSREFTIKGHESYFLLGVNKSDDVNGKQQYLNNLKNSRVIKDYFEVEYKHPKLRGKLAHLTFSPYLSNQVLQKEQEPVISKINKVIDNKSIDLCVFADRSLLFVLPKIKDSTKTIIDWVDSLVLYRVRELKLNLKDRWFAGAPGILRFLADAYVEERFYGKQSGINITVSPVDKKYLDSVNNVPEKNRVLLNGIDLQNAKSDISKIRNRIIFSGNMSFPPNYESAIWFIDKVMPLLRKRTAGDVKLIIAGAAPVEKLRLRSAPDVEITGFVEDMSHEIAVSSVYVAPLVSGGGFKNKIIEAITNGTFIVATSMAIEFLEEEVRAKFLIADDPEQFTEHVLAIFREPGKFAERLAELQMIIEREFTWSHRADEFIQIAHEVLQ